MGFEDLKLNWYFWRGSSWALYNFLKDAGTTRIDASDSIRPRVCSSLVQRIAKGEMDSTLMYDIATLADCARFDKDYPDRLKRAAFVGKVKENATWWKTSPVSSLENRLDASIARLINESPETVVVEAVEYSKRATRNGNLQPDICRRLESFIRDKKGNLPFPSETLFEAASCSSHLASSVQPKSSEQ